MNKHTTLLTPMEITNVAVVLEELSTSEHIDTHIQDTVAHIHELLTHPNHEQIRLELITLYGALLENNAAEHELEPVADLINAMNGDALPTPKETAAELSIHPNDEIYQDRVNRAIENTVSTHLGA